MPRGLIIVLVLATDSSSKSDFSPSFYVLGFCHFLVAVAYILLLAAAAAPLLLVVLTHKNKKVHFQILAFILSVLAHSPHPVTVPMQQKRYRSHERSDDGHYGQRPVRP